MAFSRSDRVGGARLIGVVVGFLGVVFLIGAQPQGDWLAGLAVLLTAACYAASALYAGSRLAAAPPIVTSLGTLAVATAHDASVRNRAASRSGAELEGDRLGRRAGRRSGCRLPISCTSASSRAPARSYAVLVTYLVPAIALGYGAMFLDEQITASALGGLVLILAGVALGTGSLRLRRRVPVAEAP